MSEEATLDDFAEEQREGNNEAIEAVLESSVKSSLDETSVGKIPEDWIATRLENIAEETEYGLTESAEDYDPDKPRYIRTQDFDDFGGLKEDSRASLSHEKAKDGMLEKGDMLFARSGSVGASLGKTYLYDSDDGDCCFGGYSIRHQLQDAGLNHKYISEYTLSDRYWDWVRRRAKTTAQSNINTGEYGSLLLPIPPLPEQRKIATVLYTVDRAIENAEEIDVQLQRVKKGATQKLFTYGLNNEDTQSHHIGDFPQGWEFDKVSNLAEIERGNTPRTSHDEYYGGDLAWVTPDDLSDLNEEGNGKYISDSGRKLTPEGVESSSLTVVEPDSVMFTSRSYGIGRTAICTVPAATNQGITAFECGESLDTEFFYYYFNYIMDYVVSISGGSTFPEISKSATGNIDVPVPRIEEQKEIASLLSQFDEQILHNREVTSQLKRLKRGLMQDFLSGTVRTTDTNIEVPDEIAQHG
ncbi:restriction endonuclease subunit S [Halorubrum salsamenti]|uniref:restriction endonuclease subunit S n=1 Tax=Halorubrum salsamenti TaxID=2583990 RepID=UPI0011A46D35|nr:restriction endonuclease subunit S [Halorubrum salsamenti]